MWGTVLPQVGWGARGWTRVQGAPSPAAALGQKDSCFQRHSLKTKQNTLVEKIISFLTEDCFIHSLSHSPNAFSSIYYVAD